jgi:hypothetical protein
LDCSPEEKQFLRQCGFTSIGVRNNPKGSAFRNFSYYLTHSFFIKIKVQKYAKNGGIKRAKKSRGFRPGSFSLKELLSRIQQ